MFRNTKSFSRPSPSSSMLMLLLLLCGLSSTVAFRSSGLQLQQRSSFVVSTTRQVSYSSTTKQQQPQQTYTKQQQHQHRRSRSSSSELNMFMGSDGGILGVGTPEVVRHTLLFWSEGEGSQSVTVLLTPGFFLLCSTVVFSIFCPLFLFLLFLLSVCLIYLLCIHHVYVFIPGHNFVGRLLCLGPQRFVQIGPRSGEIHSKHSHPRQRFDNLL